ncbi:MAG TPA: toxin TcdB middle/N-terminal domain-containing protein, partial [Actinomycetota bacterium]|nr:toxin TcdB middle/N-terminal domain-containing protein [Actinomycetota bacterium]
GLADVVLVAGNEIRYAVNRNAARFDAAVTLTSAEVEGDLPERMPGMTTVLFADMNGSGSRDIVWITGNRVRFLEIFPVRPNLLSRIENGLGGVQQIEYGTSVLQQARDESTDPWLHRLPHPMNVVTSMDVWNRLFATETGGLHERTALVYRDGFYDGTERAFRGYARIERTETADMAEDGQNSSLTVFDYDLGVTEPERHGLMLRAARFDGSPGSWTPLSEQRSTWEDCPVAMIPGSGLPREIHWICETEQISINQEGAPQAEWRTIRTETEYNGYGNITRRVEHGVVHLGPPEAPTACGACAPGSGPCGATCTGDEQYVETTYIEPGPMTSGEWILGRPVRRITYTRPGGMQTEEVTRYDGPDFVGLPEGQLTEGDVTSVRTRLDATAFVDTQRVRYDANGNIVEEIGPNGTIADATQHRRVITYDELGIRIARVEDFFVDGDGQPASLRREYTYEAAFYEVSESTDWMLVRGGSPVTGRNAERYRYDAFGRVIALLRAGDADGTPSEEYAYELGDPVSRVITRSRSRAGGALDTEDISCLDGQGRTVQSRTRVADGSYEVSGFQVLNRRGHAVRVYQEFLSASGDCDMSPPTSVPYDTFRYDGLDRLVETTEATESVHGSRNLLTVRPGPLTLARYDAIDNDATHEHTGTPLVEVRDGLGRLVAVRRDLGDGTIATTALEYDELGNLQRVTAPDGVVHAQTYDLLGRVLTADDPDRGMIRYRYDAAGNLIERTDARGRRTMAAYDGLNRQIAQWDAEDEAGTRTELRYDEDPDCSDCDHGARRLVSMRYQLGALGEGLDQV